MSDKNYLGKRFGRLIILEDCGRNSYSKLVKCQCDCGNIKIITLCTILAGRCKSCGCIVTGPDIIGHRFGKLVVISRYDDNNTKHAYYKAKCDCGNEVIVRKNELTSETFRYKKTKCPSCTYKNMEKYCKQLPTWIVRQIETGAKTRNIEYKLNIEYLADLLIKQDFKCALSGIQLNITPIKFRRECNLSLDRIDSRLGYIDGNVQWVDKDINRMKWVLSTKRFIELCEKVTNHANSSSSSNSGISKTTSVC